MPPSDKEHDGSGPNSHRHDPKGKQREQTVCEEVSEGATYQAYTYPIDDTVGYSQEYASYPAALGSSGQSYSGYSSHIKSASSTYASTSQSYVECSSDYQPQPQELPQSSEHTHIVSPAILRDERLDSTAGGIPESLTATFYARNMTATEQTNEMTRRMEEEEADEVWANRSNVCEKHKKDKKRCDPDKCPNNKRRVRDQEKETPTSEERETFREALYVAYPDKRFRRERRQKIYAFNRSTRKQRAKIVDEIRRLAQRKQAKLAEYKRAADERRRRDEQRRAEQEKLAQSKKSLYESCRVGYGDDLEAVEKFDYDFGLVLKNNEITTEPSGAAYFATSQLSSTSSNFLEQAVNPSTLPSVENDPAQSSPEEIDQTPSDPNRHDPAPSAEPEQYPEPNSDLLVRRDATEAEEQKWRASGRDSQEVPRTVWGGLGKADIHRYSEEGYSTQFDYVPENSSLALFEPVFVSSVDGNNASNRSGGRLDDGDSGNGDDDDGSDDQNMGDGDPNDKDYGDWGRDYYDGYGEGPSGSWQPNSGGGYRKGPGGEYYALAPELNERLAKMSLK